ncbi:TPA: hypothetical protein VDU83_002554 [Pseudomonas aeruginosa]|nr:hypothetical protein [Pseudomonas aeruginosa]
MAKLNPFTFPYDGKVDPDGIQNALSESGAKYVEKRSTGRVAEVANALAKLDELIESAPPPIKQQAVQHRRLLVDHWNSLPEADEVEDVGEKIRELLAQMGHSK